jgi:hypothetical protein
LTPRTLRLVAAVVNAIFFVSGCAIAILPESTVDWFQITYGVMMFVVPVFTIFALVWPERPANLTPRPAAPTVETGPAS